MQRQPEGLPERILAFVETPDHVAYGAAIRGYAEKVRIFLPPIVVGAARARQVCRELLLLPPPDGGCAIKQRVMIPRIRGCP